MKEEDIAMPIHLLRVRKEPDGWIFYQLLEIFYNPTGRPVNLKDRWLDYGLTHEKIQIELFRIGRGQTGEYLVDLREKKYYYCGLEFKDLKKKLLELGVGRRDPIG